MGPSPGTYSFGAVYATSQVRTSLYKDIHPTDASAIVASQTFMQGNFDNEGGVTGRFNYGWSPKDLTKLSVQVSTIGRLAVGRR